MLHSYRRAVRAALLVVPMAAVSVATLSSGHTAAAATPTVPKVGIVCTSDTAHGTSPTFDLTTDTGYIDLPDGNTMFMWGYKQVGKHFQHPGPVLCVKEGDTVTVHLHNVLPKAASIVFPGQENVLADGLPAQPEFSGSTVTSLTKTAPTGGDVAYSFVAAKPGTYVYESGTDPETQVRMGLFGALIVHPAMGANFAYNRADSEFTPSEEFLVLLSEIDPFQHQAVENGEDFDFTGYKARYWLINGRGFPDTVADNGASFLPNQPYGALARIHEYKPLLATGDPNYHPNPGLARYINVGSEDYPFHPHGNNGAVIARDGEPLVTPEGLDASFEKYSINVGPGQTWDVLVRWYDAEQYNATANPIAVALPAPNTHVYGMFYSGSPYLGAQGTLNPGAATKNQCGEFYVIAHNHALNQITSWGVTMSGPITYMRIDPPLPNSCPN